MAEQQHTPNNTPQEPPIRTLLKYIKEWIKSNVLLVLAIPAVLLFMSYYEDEYVDLVHRLAHNLNNSTWGYPLVWVTLGLLFVILIYCIVRRISNQSNADSRTVYAAIFVTAVFGFALSVVTPGAVPQDNLPASIKFALWVCMILLWWLCFILPLFFFLRNKRMNNQLEKKAEAQSRAIGYIDDEPVADSGEDALVHKPYVPALINCIQGIRLGHTGSIAITGSWGAGKTSFVRLLEEELKSDDYKDEFIFLTFEPMRCERPELIQAAFFDQLEAALSPFRSGFPRYFRHYKELIGAVDNKYAQFVTTLFSISQEDARGRIQRGIQSLHRRIVVFIDDVDRLDRQELEQVFRLVGFNAKFSSLVFLLAMDKTKVEATMGDNDNYSDKFAEVEFYLPRLSPNAIWDFVQDKVFSRLEQSESELCMADKGMEAYTKHCLPTMRDAKRFVNGFNFRFILMNLSDKYSFRDYFLLSLLHYADPNAFDIIAQEESFDKRQGQLVLTVKQDEFYGTRVKADNILWNLVQTLFPPKVVEQTDESWYGINNSLYFFQYFNEVSAENTTVVDKAWSLLTGNLNYNEIRAKISEWEEKPNFIKKLFRYFKYFPIDNLSDDDPRVGKYFIVCDILKIEELDFSEGLAAVEKGGKWGFIDKTGAVKIPFEYEGAWEFSEGLALVEKGEKYGYIDKAGAVKIPFEYDDAWSFSEGLAIVKKGKKYGFVDQDGEVKIPIEYDDAGRFSEGRALVEKDGKKFDIDKEGKRVLGIMSDEL